MLMTGQEDVSSPYDDGYLQNLSGPAVKISQIRNCPPFRPFIGSNEYVDFNIQTAAGITIGRRFGGHSIRLRTW